MVGIAWRFLHLHAPTRDDSAKDINALYIKESVNGKQRFTPMAAYCKCCGALRIYPEWEQKNEARV